MINYGVIQNNLRNFKPVYIGSSLIPKTKGRYTIIIDLLHKMPIKVPKMWNPTTAQ